ncbi:hypothetical protein CFR71_10240 [Novacetimonas pomaceti]|uniref:Uncharacterized protein n=1 Tax=Novacetimonas pomaceti TaxID=2021998 RepID=A0A318QIX6_9PROT|nr:hypothetical protein CFR71_10240 [Novacetimonas pomaceti]
MIIVIIVNLDGMPAPALPVVVMLPLSEQAVQILGRSRPLGNRGRRGRRAAVIAFPDRDGITMTDHDNKTCGTDG